MNRTNDVIIEKNLDLDLDLASSLKQNLDQLNQDRT